MKERTSDVVIIGGGPAGLAAALALRARGADCTVIDGGLPPLDKPCGEGLMPDSRAALARLGVNIDERHGATFSGIRFKRGELSVEGSFPEGAGVGVRRTVLHQALVERSHDAGVRLLWGKRARLERGGALTVDGAELAYRWLVGADGQNSSVRSWFGLDRGERVSVRFGFRQHFRVEPWTGRMELHWSDIGQMYVTPVSAGEVCVAFLSRKHELRLEEAMRFFPELQQRLLGAQPASRLRGAITSSRQLERVAGDNIALIGDAAGSVDAVTGEGLALSFRQAIALADAIEGGDLKSYCASHEKIVALPARMARIMLLLDRFPALQKHTLRSLSRRPQAFEHMLAAHVGARSLPVTVLEEVPQFALNFAISALAAEMGGGRRLSTKTRGA